MSAGAVGFVDAVTTYDFALVSLLFDTDLLGVLGGRGAAGGWLLALVCAVIWLVAHLEQRHPYHHPLLPLLECAHARRRSLCGGGLCAFVRPGTRTGACLEARSQLENQNERLEQTVQQRTAALQSEIAERKRLEKANLQTERLAVVGAIAAQVAHEVRNPLGSITLNLDLIAQQIDKLADTSSHPAEEGRTLVTEMREEVHRIQHVIEDYLRFARLRNPQRKPVRLNEFLDQKLAFMGSAFENASVRLRTDFDAGLNTINADAEQLWQALLNLVRNSLEAMPRGGALAIVTRQSNGEVILSVADTGKGMTDEELKQVFVPFFTTKPRGTGLGLARSRSRFSTPTAPPSECASIAGKGSTFTIRFPLETRT